MSVFFYVAEVEGSKEYRRTLKQETHAVFVWHTQAFPEEDIEVGDRLGIWWCASYAQALRRYHEFAFTRRALVDLKEITREDFRAAQPGEGF